MSPSILPFTPGPWSSDWRFIVAPDPLGRFPDVYIAELADSDDDGRLPPPDQFAGNARLIAAAPDLFDAVAWAAHTLAAAPPFVTAGGLTRDALIDRLTAVLGLVFNPTTPPGKDPA